MQIKKVETLLGTDSRVLIMNKARKKVKQKNKDVLAEVTNNSLAVVTNNSHVVSNTKTKRKRVALEDSSDSEAEAEFDNSYSQSMTNSAKVASSNEYSDEEIIMPDMPLVLEAIIPLKRLLGFQQGGILVLDIPNHTWAVLEESISSKAYMDYIKR